MPVDWVKEYDAFQRILKYAPIEPPESLSLSGRGIITCAGGRYFPPAWVLIRQLRALGCELPIQIWHLGPEEISDSIREYVSNVDNVELVDTRAIAHKYNIKRVGGWESKIYAIMYSPFKEVLFLDSDNVPVKNPEYLFDSPEYLNTGSVFWPDYERLEANRSIWQVCNVEYRDEPEFETGQILVNKAACWKELAVTKHMNEHSAFYYRHIWGDKDTFHMAWRACNREYSMPPFPIKSIPFTMCQHDFQGDIIFQHRNLAKWSIGTNTKIPGFLCEKECLGFLSELNLESFVDGPGILFNTGAFNSTEKKYLQMLIDKRFWKIKLEGQTAYVIELLQNGKIGQNRKADVYSWVVEKKGDVLNLIFLDSKNNEYARLVRLSPSRWRGYISNQARYTVELKER